MIDVQNQPANKSTKLIIGIIIAAIIIIGGYYAISKKEPSSQEPVKIGFIGPLTGDAAAYGEMEKNVIELALQEINNSTEFNRKIEAIYEDGKCNGKDAVTAAQKLINIDKVKIILGGTCSAETLGVAPLAEANKVILFSSFSSNPSISQSGDYIFRNIPPDTDMGKADAEFIASQGIKTVAFITENTDYSQGLRGVMKKIFEQKNVAVVDDEVFNSGVKDFRTNLIKIKSSNPQAIYINVGTSPASVGIIAKQIQELGIKNISLFSNFMAGDKDAISAGGQAMEGIIFCDFKDITKSAGSLLEKYKTIFQKDPVHIPLMAGNYDAVYIIKNAIKQCGGDDSTCIKNYLYNMSEYNGTIGEYKFDSNGDMLISDFFAHKKIINGTGVEIK